MKRRSFFTKLGLAAASMAILPAATTYARHWVKPAGSVLMVPNPAWETAPFEVAWFIHNGVNGFCAVKSGMEFHMDYKILSEPERLVPDREHGGLFIRVPKLIPV